MTAIGFGTTELVTKSLGAITLKVDLNVMPQRVCLSRPGYGPGRINDTMVCAGDGQPSVFTRVQNHLDWIDAAIRLDPSRGSYP